MAENSKIEWTTHTFNPWRGCQKVSAGCDNCYAENMLATRWKQIEWGPHGERVRTKPATWAQPMKWQLAAKSAGERHRVFCASLADWLDNKVPDKWRDDLRTVIEATPDLDWMLLTKRIENFSKLSPWPWQTPPENVWLGISAEDQAHYDRRWARLKTIQTQRTFISYEPALGPLTLGEGPHPAWMLCGGESGPGARMMDLGWARNLRDECAAKGVPYFFKQVTGKGEIPPDLMVREYPPGMYVPEAKVAA